MDRSVLRKLFRRFNGLVILNISGLSLGLAGVIFIAVWVSHEMSYDRFCKNAARIYRVESQINLSGDPTVWTITPAPVADAMKSDFPEVEDAVVMRSGFRMGLKADDELFTTENLYFTTHSFFTIFSPEIISGDPDRLLAGPDEIVLSRRIAKVLFGDNEPVGKTVLLNNTYVLTVTGVMENSPTNTHLKVDYLVPFSLLKKNGDDLESWGRIDYLTYVLLKAQTDPEQFNDKLSGYWQTKNSGFSGVLFINPLTRLYLYRDPGFKSIKYPSSDQGPITRVILFSVIGFVLLLIACINFINLSTAFASQRAKEIGIRKANGASRINLIFQLFGESLLQTSLATIAAIILVVILLPVFVRICGVELHLPQLLSIKNLSLCLILTLFTGLVSGIYPALILSSFSLVMSLKPMPGDTFRGSGLRKILVIVQFGLAFVFVFSILVINRQINFMQQSDLGFDRESVMAIYPRTKPESIDVIAEQIERFPGVQKVALGGNVPVNMGNFSTMKKWDGNDTDKPLMFYMMQVDDKYLDLLDIKLINGRNFYKGTIAEEVIVNETAVKKMGMNEPLGKNIWYDNSRYSIVGIVKDFHFHKLKEEVRPVFIFKRKEWWMKVIFVKLEPGNHFQVVSNIIDLVQKNTPGFPLSYLFLDQETDKYYDGERRLSTLINVATILAIVISCIGLFSLTAFTIRKKRKEIGVRKAYGASISSVLVMLQKDFGGLVLISAIISLPAGYYIAKQWLDSYANHIKITPVYFIVTTLIVLVLSFMTLFFHTIKAANLNPWEALRNE